MFARGPFLVVASLLGLLTAGPSAEAAKARFHYVPVDAKGNTTLQPSQRFGTPGEKIGSFGVLRQGYDTQPRPNRMVVFVHPATSREITVPLALPADTPRMEYRGDRVIYNYGSYTVEVRFLTDGSADVVYDAGFLRDL